MYCRRKQKCQQRCQLRKICPSKIPPFYSHIFMTTLKKVITLKTIICCYSQNRSKQHQEFVTLAFFHRCLSADNIKIIINLLTELESYLKRYLKRKQSFKTVTQRQNKQKIRRRKSVAKVPPLKELRAVSIKLLDYKYNSVQRMKSTTCLHLKSPLRKRGAKRAKLKFKEYFPDLEFDMDLTYKTRISKR